MTRTPWYLVLLVVATAGLALAGCEAGGGGGGDDDDDVGLPDADADGLADEFEDEVGTDPAAEDSDGDGYLDGDEWSAFTDPLNADDYEYEGGYGHWPYPDDLAGTGTAEGAVVGDFTLTDFYGQQVSLYSFYGNVIHVFAAADW